MPNIYLEPRQIRALTLGETVRVTHWFSVKPSLIRPSILKAKEILKRVEFAVEVGVFCGDNALYISKLLRPKELYLVDIWDGNGEIYSGEECIELVHKQLKGYAHHIMREPSVEAARKFLDCTLDFVYIDAEHDYKNTCDDINAWYSKVKYGGIMAGHDYCRKSVKRAVKDSLEQEVIALGHPRDLKRDWMVIK